MSYGCDFIVRLLAITSQLASRDLVVYNEMK